MEKGPFKHSNGEGRYRDTYIVGPKKDHIAKIPKAIIEKKYPLGTIPYPSEPYTLLKFGKANINEVDYANYQKLPEAVRNNFTPNTRMINGVIVQERMQNYDGTPSVSIEEHTQKYGKIQNKFFWETVEKLKQAFLLEEQPLLGVFHRGSNILVKKLSENEWIPIMIDFKRLGARSYPFQPHLNIKDRLQKKFLRQFKSFEEDYKPTETAIDASHLTQRPQGV